MRPLESPETSPKEAAIIMRRVWCLLSISSFLASATYLHAQGYPNQPINLVLPYAPGDTGDVAGRAMADELAKILEVPFVPVNRPELGPSLGRRVWSRPRRMATRF